MILMMVLASCGSVVEPSTQSGSSEENQEQTASGITAEEEELITELLEEVIDEEEIMEDELEEELEEISVNVVLSMSLDTCWEFHM